MSYLVFYMHKHHFQIMWNTPQKNDIYEATQILWANNVYWGNNTDKVRQFYYNDGFKWGINNTKNNPVC